MTVHEIVGAAGAWSVTLSPELPDEILKKLGYFGHIVIVRGKVDVEATSASLLSKARYVGVFREVDRTDQRTLSGPGMVTWLGDEDEKGPVIESVLKFTSQPLATVLPFFIPVSLRLGTVYPLADTTLRYTGSHQFETMRSALNTICDFFGIEYRVNGDGTVDFGRPDQLYTSVPDSIIVRKGAGTDLDLTALGGSFDVKGSGVDYSTRVLLLGQKTGDGTTPDVVFATGSADAPSVPHFDLFGNPVKLTRMISESGTSTASVFVRAQLALNRFNRLASSLKVTAEDYHISGNFRCGDNTFVYDPETGIVNAANERTFRGEVLHPDIVRVNEVTWPVSDDHTVAFRADSGEWIDLTRYVLWESGTTDLVVGDKSKSLVNTGSNPVQSRVTDALKDSRKPNPPTGVTLATSSTVNPQGVNSGVINVSWTAPTTNADGSTLAGVDHYVIRFRWQGRAPQWQWVLTTDLSIDLSVALGLPYDVGVAAVGTGGVYSDYTVTQTITSAVDSAAPPAPADPVVTSYLGQLRIEYAGTDSTGAAMPADTNRIDVHVGTTSSFAWSNSTRVSSITPFAKGVAYATAPYGSPRWVLLVAYDHTGNVSATSARISGTTVQAGDGDIAALSVGKLTAGTMSADVVTSGRFTTALTGARREMNAVGFQAFDSSNNLSINLDGVNNLLTGLFKTALAGRRIEIGSAGSVGQINFIAPDGTQSLVQSYSASSGVEALRVKVPVTGTVSDAWNAFSLDTGEGLLVNTGLVQLTVGGNGPSTSKGLLVRYASNRGSGTTAPAAVNRMWIDDTDFFIYDALGHLRQWISPQDYHYYSTGGVERLSISAVTEAVTFNMAGPEFAEIRHSDNISRSAQLALVHPTALYAASLAYVASSADGSTTPRLEVKDSTNTVFIPVYASAFTVSSAEAGKNDIVDFSGDALSILRSARPRTYSRVQVSDHNGKQAKGTRATELGFVAEESPAEFVTRDDETGDHGVDLYALATLNTAAIVQLAEIVDKLRKGKP